MNDELGALHVGRSVVRRWSPGKKVHLEFEVVRVVFDHRVGEALLEWIEFIHALAGRAPDDLHGSTGLQPTRRARCIQGRNSKPFEMTTRATVPGESRAS